MKYARLNDNREIVQVQPYFEDGFIEVDDYVICGMVYDGTTFYVPAQPEREPTSAELKAFGKQYASYQIPLDEEAQIAVTSVAVQYLAGIFTGTVFNFSNGVKMHCTTEEFLPFAKWFATERNKFFIGE